MHSTAASFWSRPRVASDGATSAAATWTMIETETMIPAATPSTPRSRRIGASQPKTL